MSTITIDNRGLQPPDPMVRILGALAEMDDEDELVALMDREPLLLFPELERRGFDWVFDEGEEHHVLTIHRPRSAP